MPYDVRQNDKSKWETYNTDTGEVKGTHDTQKEAEDHRAALYANVPDARKQLDEGQQALQDAAEIMDELGKTLKKLTTVPLDWPEQPKEQAEEQAKKE